MRVGVLLNIISFITNNYNLLHVIFVWVCRGVVKHYFIHNKQLQSTTCNICVGVYLFIYLYLTGPGLNFFLTKANFYIGPFIVNEYTAPGVGPAVGIGEGKLPCCALKPYSL